MRRARPTCGRRGCWAASSIASSISRAFAGIAGTVESVGTFVPERGAADRLRVRVQSKQGESSCRPVGSALVCRQIRRENASRGLDFAVTGSLTTFEGRDVSYRRRSRKTAEPIWCATPTVIRSGSRQTSSEPIDSRLLL